MYDPIHFMGLRQSKRSETMYLKITKQGVHRWFFKKENIILQNGRKGI